ncbi:MULTISPECIES: hypothetical protein [Microcystis]|jgi:hypothetical protein|uniref:Uncharacterized protein n=2 Tax=Microcystis TaxID=1125 RepID=B0JMT2_MICAN|nr:MULTISPECIES: hypothetical protein [Microcystis]BAG03367.1 unknown protein [Microcystis aeruginosa NIES-843]BBH38556.1 unknown protein [Microcystis viridis NIES-102]
MLLGGLEFVLLGFLFGAAAVALAIISIATVMEIISDYWDDLDDEVLIIAPEASSELEKIAKQKGSKKHKRFVYNTSTKEALLVESNSISNELEDEDVVYVTI